MLSAIPSLSWRAPAKALWPNFHHPHDAVFQSALADLWCALALANGFPPGQVMSPLRWPNFLRPWPSSGLVLGRVPELMLGQVLALGRGWCWCWWGMLPAVRYLAVPAWLLGLRAFGCRAGFLGLLGAAFCIPVLLAGAACGCGLPDSAFAGCSQPWPECFPAFQSHWGVALCCTLSNASQTRLGWCGWRRYRRSGRWAESLRASSAFTKSGNWFA